ncbi:MAG: D-aminoacyl-tRNA deacylase [Methanolobus sp.]
MKEKKINILCSAADQASQNIMKHLLEQKQWTIREKLPDAWEELLSVHESPYHRIIEIKGHHIYEDRIDEKMRDSGYDTDLIIVASKHKSKDGRSVLTAHFTGNPDSANFGGRPRELSIPAPGTMRSILKNMEKILEEMGDKTKYTVNMESTHHGPTDMKTPMVYAEIGSGEEQWLDPVAGDIVARAILQAEPLDVPVAVGFGGGHYAARQTGLILETGVTFGHNFPDYQLANVDREMMMQALEKSNADFVYFDRKSMSSKERERLSALVDELGYILLRESEINESEGLPWEVFLEIKKKCDEICPEGKFRITDLFRTHFTEGTGSQDSDGIFSLSSATINAELLQETISASRQTVTDILEKHAPIYIERKNGTISNYVLGIGEESKTAMQNVTNECIKILKEHYEIKYIPEENILYIITKRFDPKAAKELGIPPGPMLGELAKGNPIVIDGETIEPKMVHKRNVRKILLSN